MLHFTVQVRAVDPNHRSRSNEGWEDRIDILCDTEPQAQDILRDYQCGTRTIITASSDNEFRIMPVRTTAT